MKRERRPGCSRVVRVDFPEGLGRNWDWVEGKVGGGGGWGEDLRNKLSCVSFGGQFVRRTIEARERFASSDFSDHAHECPIISRCSNS
jgi:hypothetical protein